MSPSGSRSAHCLFRLLTSIVSRSICIEKKTNSLGTPFERNQQNILAPVLAKANLPILVEMRQIVDGRYGQDNRNRMDGK